MHFKICNQSSIVCPQNPTQQPLKHRQDKNSGSCQPLQKGRALLFSSRTFLLCRTSNSTTCSSLCIQSAKPLYQPHLLLLIRPAHQNLLQNLDSIILIPQLRNCITKLICPLARFLELASSQWQS